MFSASPKPNLIHHYHQPHQNRRTEDEQWSAVGQRLISAGHPAALGARTAPGDEEIVFILLEGE